MPIDHHNEPLMAKEEAVARVEAIDRAYRLLTPDMRLDLFARSVQAFYLDDVERLKRYTENAEKVETRIRCLEHLVDFFRFQTFILKKYGRNLHWRLDTEDNRVFAGIWVFYQGKEVKILDIMN